MAKILVKGEWFEELSPGSLYEDDFERLVTDNATFLYPQFITAPFKTAIESEYGVAKPDFALVSASYGEWWVVEVELAHHPFEGHVLPQVRCLSEGVYGLGHAKYLCARNNALSLVEVEQMMKGKQPRVLVIVNMPCPEWTQPLRQWGACVAIVQLYLSERNQFALRVNGEHPAPRVEQAAECFFEPPLPLLIVDTPVLVPPTAGLTVRIYYQERLTEWERIETKDRILLNPVAANPLNIKHRYRLERRSDGTLAIFEKGH
jgi:hypothetical protein